MNRRAACRPAYAVANAPEVLPWNSMLDGEAYEIAQSDPRAAVSARR